MDFSKWNVNTDELKKQIKEAKDNQPTGESLETPAGSYVAKIEKMELAATKDGRPMFKVMLRVIEAGEDATPEVTEYLSHFKNKKPCLFMNRVVAGTKNDGAMLNSVFGWLNKLEAGEPLNYESFKGYDWLADTILDIFEEVSDAVELEVDYDPEAFNIISITDVFDV